MYNPTRYGIIYFKGVKYVIVNEEYVPVLERKNVQIKRRVPKLRDKPNYERLWSNFMELSSKVNMIGDGTHDLEDNI